MSDLRDIIPGYREALEQEELQRNAAFLGVTELICGVEVLPLTLTHLCRLQCVGSPFTCGGVPVPSDAAVLLWAVSPGYAPKAWFRRYLFTRGIRKIAFIDAVTGINAYMADSFIDAPCGKEGFTPSYWSGFASIIGLLSSEFGWSEREILGMPVKRVWQYVRIAEKRNNPKAWFPNRSHQVRAKWLEEMNYRKN